MTGVPVFCKAGNATASITATSADGQIDLNLASRDLIVFVLSGEGLGDGLAQRLATEIIDYRSLGGTARSGDAKADLYAAAGLPFDAKAAPFASVDELDQLPSMTRDLLEVIAPLFTVRSGCD